MNDPADRGLLVTMLELSSDGTPTTTTDVAEAVGVPDEYADVIEQRLEQNRDRGFIDSTPDGRWRLTAAGLGLAAACSR